MLRDKEGEPESMTECRKLQTLMSHCERKYGPIALLWNFLARPSENTAVNINLKMLAISQFKC